jgi:hypothetical protein
MNEFRDRALEVLVSPDPRRAVDRTLGLVVGLMKANGAALFRVMGNRPILICGRGIDQAGLNKVQVAWSEGQKPLAEGEFQIDSRHAVLPLRSERGLVALLYVASDEAGFGPLDRVVSEVGPIFLAAVAELDRQPAEASPVDAFLEHTSLKEIERERLLLLLNRNEWNIARVSRIMGVSRVTIYQKLLKHGISRQRVPKGPPRPAPSRG